MSNLVNNILAVQSLVLFAILTIAAVWLTRSIPEVFASVPKGHPVVAVPEMGRFVAADRVSYHSIRRGERRATVLGFRNGHVILHVDGHPVNVTLRRRPHLLTPSL